MKRVLIIAGSDAGGGAGIQGDLKTVSSFGVWGMTVVTALTAQDTKGVLAVHQVPAEFVYSQIKAVLDDIGSNAVKIGMLHNSEIVECVSNALNGAGPVVLDPVMLATDGTRLLDEAAVKVLKEKLLPITELVTPNIPEAEELSNLPVNCEEDMEEAGKRIQGFGAKAVLVKGGHLPGNGEIVDLLVTEKETIRLKNKRLDGGTVRGIENKRLDAETVHGIVNKPFDAGTMHGIVNNTFDTGTVHGIVNNTFDAGTVHGTGCALSSAVSALLASGFSLRESAIQARRFLQFAIRAGSSIGKGYPVLDHLVLLKREAKRIGIIKSLSDAFEELCGLSFAPLIPEIQTNFAFALPWADAPEDVAAFPGRIVRVGNKIAAPAPPAFGASRHVARVVLTVMRYNPGYRSCLNIRYDQLLLKRFEDSGFNIASFDRGKEPAASKAREGSSLEWGTDFVLKSAGKIPDIIFDRGDVGKEPIIRILGCTPGEIIGKVRIVLGAP